MRIVVIVACMTSIESLNLLGSLSTFVESELHSFISDTTFRDHSSQSWKASERSDLLANL